MQMTLYFLIFGRDLKLLIKEAILSENTILDRIIKLIYKVSIFKKNAKVVINKAQQRIRANYQIQQIREFAIGDQVLYDDNSNYHGKLESK